MTDVSRATDGTPATTMAESQTTGARARSAPTAASTARVPMRAEAAKDSSAVAWTMRATTSRAPPDHAEKSTLARMIR
jgi:hypothetical protein